MLQIDQVPPAPQRMPHIARTFFPPKMGVPAGRRAQHDDLTTIPRLMREGAARLQIRRATVRDLGTILALIEEAKEWLRTKETDQWSTDWPDKDGRKRSDRVQSSLENGTTWLLWLTFRGREIPVATITIEEKANAGVWMDTARDGKSAAYLSRLITARSYSGLQIGSALIDWACTYAAREYCAELIRIDVWTTNHALHHYYEKQGFEPCGLSPDESYPARALFSRPVMSLHHARGAAITLEEAAKPQPES